MKKMQRDATSEDKKQKGIKRKIETKGEDEENEKMKKMKRKNRKVKKMMQ